MAVHRRLQVRSTTDNVLLLEGSWRHLTTPVIGKTWQSIDIALEQVTLHHTIRALNHQDNVSLLQLDEEDGNTNTLPESVFSAKAFEFFLHCLRTAAGKNNGRLVKLIVPLQEGYLVRSDIIPLRLQDSQYVEVATSFADPLQVYRRSSVPLPDSLDISKLFSTSTAGLLLRQDIDVSADEGIFEALSLAVESDLDNRLSFPWILPELPMRKTLVLVDSNSAHPEDGLGFYIAARELGINVVVLDNAGHWLDEPEHAHWREAFVPMRLTNPPSKNLATHILNSVKAYGRPVDGIITFADTFWPYIAQAAQELGIETASPDAFRIATNKYLTSKYVGHEAYHASSLDEALVIAENNNLPYPLIIKPCDGWSSEGVSRIDSQDMLETAIKSIHSSRHGNDFVMEKYCDGPEVDINFVLLDGELLFFEVCDDLPKSADINGPSIGSLTNFHELNSVYPSILPEKEIKTLRDGFLDTLLRLGLRNGIMHLEGRVEHCSVEYKTRDGIIDLAPRDSEQAHEPTAWLIEINPRPLGMTGSQIIESTYGIDYWGLASLIAVGDKARVRALSQPFKYGPQYTCVMVFIPVDFPSSCQGIFNSDDICADLKARRPDLARQISRCACLFKRGQKAPHPSTGRNTFLAYFNVFSREGRKAALELARQVREEVRFSFI
ncbi:hypothetical protein QQS21_000943 [Conoideocrella luteorostrata]|uniref:ATP-grasp domain-containing protein n=1 Tax=Conoideocrella luteorostrata TaxID=1105319 RepID=A0AAJ0CXX9_9HYPO|nr:hypothetical protein QQS21_000943 [Conoideocrella luteorostrata]